MTAWYTAGKLNIGPLSKIGLFLIIVKTNYLLSLAIAINIYGVLNVIILSKAAR